MSEQMYLCMYMCAYVRVCVQLSNCFIVQTMLFALPTERHSVNPLSPPLCMHRSGGGV